MESSGTIPNAANMMAAKMESATSPAGRLITPSINPLRFGLNQTRSACAGSFIRANSQVQYGISFLQALSEKYVEELHGDELDEIVVLGSVGNVQVEAVGLDKVRRRLSRLDRLRVASLDGTLVSFPDTPGKIRETCPSTLGPSYLASTNTAAYAHT